MKQRREGGNNDRQPEQFFRPIGGGIIEARQRADSCAVVAMFFRPIGGGIIEARHALPHCAAWETFFRPIGGGIIEANLRVSKRFRQLAGSSALLGAASLKLILASPRFAPFMCVLPPYWGRHH